MSHEVAISVAVKTVLGTVTFLCGATATVWAYFVQDFPFPDVIKWILGPTGVLVVLVIALWVLFKYLRDKERRIEELNKSMLDDAKRDTDFWKEMYFKEIRDD